MKILITSDFHLRADRPRCRMDEDWLKTQSVCLQFIYDTFKLNKCDLLYIAGDICHTPTIPPNLERLFIDTFYSIKDKMYILPGNHCLRYHDYKNVDKASYGVLRSIFNEHGHAYGTLEGVDESNQLFTGVHELIWPSEKDKPGVADGFVPDEIFDLFPKTQYIFAGDYHHNFIASNKRGQVLINPGCLTRQAADYKNYTPLVYILDTDKGIVNAHFVPDTEPVVTDNYLRVAEERDSRMDAFIELMGKNKNVTLDFRANLEKKFKGLPVEVRTEIQDILEEVS